MVGQLPRALLEIFGQLGQFFFQTFLLPLPLLRLLLLLLPLLPQGQMQRPKMSQGCDQSSTQ